MRVPLLKREGKRLEFISTEFELNDGHIGPEELPGIMKEFDLEQMNCLSGLLKRLLAYYATWGLGSQNPGYYQALEWAVQWMRVLKKKAEMQAQRKAKLEAYRAWSDTQNWGFGMSQAGGLYAPFNGQVYTSKAKMQADARALGFAEVGNDDIVADAQRTQKQDYEMQQKIKARQVEVALEGVMSQIPVGTRFTMH